jgi:hypothetical protein
LGRLSLSPFADPVSSATRQDFERQTTLSNPPRNHEPANNQNLLSNWEIEQFENPGFQLPNYKIPQLPNVVKLP